MATGWTATLFSVQPTGNVITDMAVTLYVLILLYERSTSAARASRRRRAVSDSSKNERRMANAAVGRGRTFLCDVLTESMSPKSVLLQNSEIAKRV
jgi:hypothetical protein